MRQTTFHHACCSWPYFASGPCTCSMRCSSSQPLNLSVGPAAGAFAPATRASGTRGGSRPKDGLEGITSRTPNTSFFGAYEVSCRVRAERVKPYASLSADDSPREPYGPCGSPAPDTTRELGVVAMLLSLIDIRLGEQFVNTRESSLFTQRRRR